MTELEKSDNFDLVTEDEKNEAVAELDNMLNSTELVNDEDKNQAVDEVDNLLNNMDAKEAISPDNLSLAPDISQTETIDPTKSKVYFQRRKADQPHSTPNKPSEAESSSNSSANIEQTANEAEELGNVAIPTDLKSVNAYMSKAKQMLDVLSAQNEKDQEARRKEKALKKRQKKKDKKLSAQTNNGGVNNGETTTVDQEDEITEPEDKPTTAQLKARIRDRIKSSREGRISQIKKKMKEKSYPLTPLFFCDTEGCSNVGNVYPCCPKCECFYYCSKECQIKDWAKHKLMCGKDPSDSYKEKLALYKQAKSAADEMYSHFNAGNYTTVIHEAGNVPAAMFASVAEKSNVLHWRRYIENPLFSTTALDAIGDLAYKVQSAIDKYPNHKIYMIVVLLNKLNNGVATECIIRLYKADGFGETMAAPNGKITKPVVKYMRK